MLDRTERNGRIQVEIKPYHAVRHNSFAIEITRGDETLYQHLSTAWGQLIVDAQELDSVDVSAGAIANQSDCGDYQGVRPWRPVRPGQRPQQPGERAAADRGLSGRGPGLGAGAGISRDLGNRLGQANALTSLGIAQRATRNYPGAARVLEEALGIIGTSATEAARPRPSTRPARCTGRAVTSARPSHATSRP